MDKTVLIVEDSRTQAMIIKKMFEREGCNAVLAFDQESAFAELRLRQLDLLVLDVFVEASNTLEHLDQYRRLAPNVPIAIMTAGIDNDPEAGPNALNKARRLKVDYLLPKPFRALDVCQICDEISIKSSCTRAA